MNRRLLIVALALPLIFVSMPKTALGKARTVKIIVSGGGLTRAIEVTDPHILDVSNIWSGDFLDRSRDAAKEPPRALQRYEVSFYVQSADNDLRKAYILYYYPNSTAEPGYIYLPGRGESWYSLNAGSIIRDGRDGKWNYAFSAWEELIKPVIAHAEAAQHQGS